MIKTLAATLLILAGNANAAQFYNGVFAIPTESGYQYAVAPIVFASEDVCMQFLANSVESVAAMNGVPAQSLIPVCDPIDLPVGQGA